VFLALSERTVFADSVGGLPLVIFSPCVYGSRRVDHSSAFARVSFSVG